MPSLRDLIVSLSLGALSSSSFAAVVLNNPGFEDPAHPDNTPPGWGQVIGQSGSTGPATGTLGTVSTDVSHDGTQSLKITMPGHDSTLDLFNFTTAQSGDATTPVTFSIWFYEGQAVDQGLFAMNIEFKHTLPGGGDAAISSAGTTTVFSTGELTLNGWKQFSVTDTASGAWDELLLHVRAIGFNNTDTQSFTPVGVVYVDGATAVPEPATVSLLGVLGVGLLGRRCAWSGRRD